MDASPGAEALELNRDSRQHPAHRVVPRRNQ